jgi:hypothetical protein
MAQFTFNGSQTMTYFTTFVNGEVLVAEPNQSYDLDTMPDDGYWSASSAPAPKSAPVEPAPAETPASPTPNA